jgi:hypothetical protein
MHNKFLTFGLIILGVAAMGLPLKADFISGTLLLDDDSGYSDGGPFTALILSGSLTEDAVNQLYSPLALAATGDPSLVGFETFCIETLVEFTPGNWGGPDYSVTGGFGVQQTDGYLTEGVAWLYEQFALGNLSNIDSNFIYNTPTSNGSLQWAIWDLIGETPAFSDPGIGSQLVTIADDALGANVMAPVTSTSQFGVEVLELTDGDAPAQDQLIYVDPVPDDGATVALLGVALLGLAVFVRRLKIVV